MLHAARTVVVFGIVSQLAGFAKVLIVAAYFGAGAELDAYYLGLIIPTFLTGLSIGLLQSSFVPIYVAARTRDDDAAARALRDAAVTWTTTALLVIALVLTIAREPALHTLAGAKSLENEPLRAAFVLLLWTAPLTALADALGLLLNVEGRFFASSAAPVISVVVSAAVLAVWPVSGTQALVFSLIAGLVCQLGFVAAGAYRAGIRVRPAFGAAHALSQSMTAMIAPLIIANLLGNLSPAFIQWAAGRAGIGALSAMGYASRLHNAIVQAVVMSVSIVLLPHFSRLISQQRHQELRRILERIFVATLVFFLAAAVFVAAGAPSAIELLIERGRFTSRDTELVSQVWLTLTLGLLGATWGIFLARLFQALQQPWLIAKLSVVSLVANVGCAVLLLPRWGVVGVAAANSLAYAIVTLLFHRQARLTLGPVLTAHTRRFVLTAVAANLLAYLLAMQWGHIARDSALLTTLGHVLIIGATNLLVVRVRPLSLTVSALLRK
jgi:putative peptidoglycan lipid II flippase